MQDGKSPDGEGVSDDTGHFEEMSALIFKFVGNDKVD